MKSIIIDDEPDAREKLELLITKYCPQLTIAAICKDASEGLAAIETHKPDLVFLDVEMPFMTGFDMLKRINKISFEVIFTTAHDHYAIRAIKFSALDYLLKPIDLEQLQEAVNKAFEKKNIAQSEKRYENFVGNLEAKEKLTSISVPTSDGFLIIKLTDIVWCSAANFYTIIYLTNKTEIVVTRTLKQFDELLSESGFVRIHNSHLINLAHLVRYIKGAGGQVEMSNGKVLDVSRRKKEELISKINP
ncbi:MAG: LytTR family DNA-binding domain-containing protein [Bacteroidia bacterium]